MPTANDVIVHSLTVARMMLHRFVDDLAPAEYLHRTTAKANCTAWLIGHLTLTYRRAITLLCGAGGAPATPAELPPLPDGYETQFSRDEGCPTAETFGDVATLMPLFDVHSRLLIEALQRIPPDQLDKPLEKPGALFKTLAEYANFMGHHVLMHTGQITLIRRSLGKPPIV